MPCLLSVQKGRGVATSHFAGARTREAGWGVALRMWEGAIGIHFPNHVGIGRHMRTLSCRIWEGGTRVVGMVAGPGVAQGATLTLPVHATDWLPSLVSMATGGSDFRRWAPPNEPPYLPGDGLDVWSTIATAGSNGTSARDWVLLEAHPAPRPQVGWE